MCLLEVFFYRRGDQLPIMTEFYNSMDADEMMWVIRIIMRRGLLMSCLREIFSGAEEICKVTGTLTVHSDLHRNESRGHRKDLF